MIKISVICLIAFSMMSTMSFSQQDKIITHFIYDKMSLNPGETGIDEGICGTAIYRNQWDKVNGAPNSLVLNVEANINRFFPGGLGMSFYHDVIGFAKQNNLLLNYAYPVITDFGTLGIGLGLGIMNYGLTPNWIPPTDDPDAALPLGFAATSFDMNLGLYWKGNENYYVGISTTHANAPRLSQDVQQGNVTFKQEYAAARHYYVMGGYTTDPIGPGALNGNILFRTDLVKNSFDFNVRYLMGNNNLKYYGGLTYRTADALAVMIGGSRNNWTLGYSYDLTISKLSSVSWGSHEILVKYCYFLPPIIKTPSKHPRWL
jgi:type IX secretion system PorP/SprF family membrane protein